MTDIFHLQLGAVRSNNTHCSFEHGTQRIRLAQPCRIEIKRPFFLGSLLTFITQKGSIIRTIEVVIIEGMRTDCSYRHLTAGGASPSSNRHLILAVMLQRFRMLIPK
ncbi:hypothetical protein GW16_09100 [Xanthomonas arboricola pv. celebensis]|nr:hypothetical protein GW16_09100 [Xanthomonas arboricola pv. celebensis]